MKTTSLTITESPVIIVTLAGVICNLLSVAPFCFSPNCSAAQTSSPVTQPVDGGSESYAGPEDLPCDAPKVTSRYRSYESRRQKVGFGTFLPTSPPRRYLTNQITETAGADSVSGSGTGRFLITRVTVASGDLDFDVSASWMANDTVAIAFEGR